MVWTTCEITAAFGTLDSGLVIPLLAEGTNILDESDTDRKQFQNLLLPWGRITQVCCVPCRGEVARQLNRAGAPGAKREPDRAKPQLVVSSAERCSGLTTPSARCGGFAAFSLMAHPPLLCEEGNVCAFVIPPFV